MAEHMLLARAPIANGKNIMCGRLPKRLRQDEFLDLIRPNISRLENKPRSGDDIAWMSLDQTPALRDQSGVRLFWRRAGNEYLTNTNAMKSIERDTITRNAR